MSDATLRTHVHEERFGVPPERLFAALHTPSSIRGWWGASRAIVMPEAGGTYALAWGDEDDPDYITIATIEAFEAPRRLRLVDYRYRAKDGGPPFEADFTTEFELEPDPEGARLRVTQRGFPPGPDGDAFLDACATGWRDTFAGVRRFLGG